MVPLFTLHAGTNAQKCNLHTDNWTPEKILSKLAMYKVRMLRSNMPHVTTKLDFSNKKVEKSSYKANEINAANLLF